LKYLISALLCLSFVAAATESLAQAPAWSKFQVLPGVADERKPQIIKVQDGSFFVAGTVFDSETEIQHFDSAGTTIWTKVYPGYLRAFDATSSRISLVTESATSIALSDGRPAFRLLSIDNTGAVQWSTGLIGGVTQPFVKIDAGGSTIFTGAVPTNTNGGDVYVAKFDTSGAMLWSDSRDYTADEFPQGLSIDGTGYTIAIRSHSDTVGQSHADIARYGIDGTFAWVNSFTVDTTTVRCAVDGTGNSFMSFQSTEPKVYVRKVNSAGATQWTSSQANTEGGFVDIEVASSGNVYVVGGNHGNLIKFDSGGNFQWGVSPNVPATGPLTIDSSENIYETMALPIKFDSNGTVKWTASFSVATSATGIALDGSNNPLAVGTTTSAGDNDVVLAKLNVTTGVESSRAQQDLGLEATAAVSSATDSAGNTYTYSVRSNQFGEALPNPVLGTNLSKYDTDGNLLWSKNLTGSASGFLTNNPALGVLLVDGTRATLYNTAGDPTWNLPNIGATGRSAAADAAGNVFIATGTNSVGGTSTIVKVNAVGTLSPAFATGPGVVSSMIVDSSNNLYVSGTKSGGGSTLAVLDKFSSVGSLAFEWSPSDVDFTFNNGSANRVILMSNQPVVVGTYQHDPDLTFIGFVALIDTAGTQQWIAEPSGAFTLTYAVADANQNIYVTGQSNNVNAPHMAVAKVANGNVLWNKTFGTQKELVAGIAMDSLNNILVPAIGGKVGEGDDDLVVGFSPNGTLLFGNGGGSYFDAGWFSVDRDGSATTDGSGNVYMAGRSFATNGIEAAHVIKFGAFFPTNGAQYVSQSAPSTMVSGQSYPVTVTMKNSGSATWTAAAGYRLDCIQGALWSKATVALAGGDSIAPGQSKTFSFNVIAPPSGGANAMQWRMDKSGSKFGEATPALSINVTAPDDAHFVSQLVSTTFAPGASFTAKVTMQNTGTTTWTQAAGYCLLSVNPTNNKTWGTNRLLVPSSASVTPGSSIVLFNTLTAPVTPGIYNMQWQMYKNGVLFGQQTTNLQITVAADNAQFISQKQIISLAPGQAFNMNVLMKNTGQSTWRQVDGFAMICPNPLNNTIWGTNRLLVPSVSTVGPGQQVTCSNALHAPVTPGTYNMSWQMYHNGQLFGDVTTIQAIVVQNPGNAQYISSIIPTSVKAGTTFTAKVTMKNTGTTTWTQATGYSMISQDPLNNTRWGTNRLLIPSSATVAPNGQIVCFNTMTAPLTPGTYPMQWQMYCNGTVFGELTPIVMITVTP